MDLIILKNISVSLNYQFHCQNKITSVIFGIYEAEPIG